MKNETVTEGLMNYQEFKQKISNFRCIESESDIKYFWNIWNDVAKFDTKMGHKPDPKYFINLIRTGEIH